MANTEFNIIAGVEIDKSSAAKAGADAFKEAQRSFGAIKVNADFASVNKGITDTKRQFNQLTESANDFGDSVERGLRRISSLAIASSALFGIAKAFQESIQASKELEKNLQDINVVLQLPTDQLKDFGKSLFDIARQTKQSFDEVSKSALEFSRQGLSTEETLKRTQAALILVNLAGIDSVRATETITSALNSFTKENLKAIDVVNKLVAVDANFAVGSKDLAEAITRVGSTAQDAGVDFNRLIAIVTAAQQVTQRGGSVIGNAFKTIFQRLQRPEVLDDLEALGIQTREVDAITGKYTGNLIASDKVLSDIAGRFKTLTQEQKAQVTSLVAGNLQGNVFKGLLNGLAISQEAYQTALTSGNAAIVRNAQLLETQDAKVKQLGLTLQQTGANIGQIGFGDIIGKTLNGLNGKEGGSAGANFLGGILKNLSGQGDEVGNEFGRIFIKSFSDILLGPGLLAVAAIGLKIAGVLKESITGILKDTNPFKSIDVSGLTQVDKALNEQLLQVKEIASSTESKVVQEQKILEIFKLQNLQLAEQSAARARGGIEGALFSRIPNGASGLSEAFSRERSAISKGVGGASPSAQPVFLPHFKTAKGFGAVANTDEYLVNNFINSGYPAIFNKDMIRTLGMPSGAIKIASGGHIPNLASGPFDDDYASLFPSKPPKGNARIVKNIARVGGEPEILEKKVNQIKAAKPAALSGIITKDFLENLLNFAEGDIQYSDIGGFQFEAERGRRGRKVTGPIGDLINKIGKEKAKEIYKSLPRPVTSSTLASAIFGELPQNLPSIPSIGQRAQSSNLSFPAPELTPAFNREQQIPTQTTLGGYNYPAPRSPIFRNSNGNAVPRFNQPAIPQLDVLRSQTPGALKEAISKELQIAVDKFGKDVIDSSSTFKQLKSQASKLGSALDEGTITQTQFAEQSNKLISNIKAETISHGQIGGQKIFKNLSQSPYLEAEQKRQLESLSTKSSTDVGALGTLQSIQKTEALSRTKLERIAQIDAELAKSKFTPTLSNPLLSLEKASLKGFPSLSEKALTRAGNIGLPLTFAAPVVAEGIGSIISGGRDDITKERIQRGASTVGQSLSTAGLLASIAPSLGPIGGTAALGGAALISIKGIIDGVREGSRDSSEDLAKRFQNLINQSAQTQQNIQGARAGNLRIQELASAPGVTKEQINIAIKEALQASREVSNPGIRSALRAQALSGDISGAGNERINNLIAQQQIRASDVLLGSSANVEKLQREAAEKTKDTNFFNIPKFLGGFTQGGQGIDEELQSRLTESRVARINQIQNPEKRQKAIEDLGNRLQGSQSVFGQKPEALFQNEITAKPTRFLATAFGLGTIGEGIENKITDTRQPLAEKFTKIFGNEAAGDTEISQAINTLKASTSTQLQVDSAYKFLLSQVKTNSDAYEEVTKAKQQEKEATEKIFKNINIFSLLTEKRNESERNFLQTQGQEAIAQARVVSGQQLGLQRARIFGAPESQLQFQQLGNERQNVRAEQETQQQTLVHGLADELSKSVVGNSELKTDTNAKNLQDIIEALGKVNNFDELNDQIKTLQNTVEQAAAIKPKAKEFQKTIAEFTTQVEQSSGKFKNASNLQNEGLNSREKQIRESLTLAPNAHPLENILNRQAGASFLQGNIPFTRSEQLTSAEQKSQGINDIIDVINKAGGKVPENLSKAQSEATTGLSKADIQKQIDLLINATPTNVGVINEGRKSALDALRDKLDNVENGEHNQAGIQEVQKSAKGLGLNISDEEASGLFKKYETKQEHNGVQELYGMLKNLSENIQRPGLASGITFKGTPKDNLDEFISKNVAPEKLEAAQTKSIEDFIKAFEQASEKGIQLNVDGQKIPVGGSITFKISDDQMSALSSTILSQVTDTLKTSMDIVNASLDVLSDNLKDTNKQIGFVPAPTVQQGPVQGIEPGAAL